MSEAVDSTVYPHLQPPKSLNPDWGRTLFTLAEDDQHATVASMPGLWTPQFGTIVTVRGRAWRVRSVVMDLSGNAPVCRVQLGP